MGRGHQSGEAEAPLLRQQPEEFHRPGAAIYNGKGSQTGFHQTGKLRQGQLPSAAEGGAPKGLIKLLDVGANLLHWQAVKQFFQGGLGGGAEDSGGAVPLHQAADGPQAGEEIGEGEHLGFVKDEDAFRQTVVFPAPGGAVGEEGFKKLDVGGDDDGGVPVFRRKPQPLLCLVIVGALVQICRGVVLQNVFCPQDFSEGICRLLDDAGVGDDIDHPPLSVGRGVLQGEGEGGDGLPAAGGDGEAVKPRPPLPAPLDALAQNTAAPLVQLSLRLLEPGGGVVPQFLEEDGDILPGATGNRLPRHKGFSIQKIGVHQAGVKHPGKEGRFEIPADGGKGDRWQLDLLLPGGVVLRRAPVEPSPEGGALLVPAVSPVRQAGVVSRRAKDPVGVPRL